MKNGSFDDRGIVSVMAVAIGVGCSAFMLMVCGCASSVNAPAAAPQAVGAVRPNVESPTGSSLTPEDADSVRLEQLWKARLLDSDGSHSTSFVLGPGDELRISIPPIEQRTVRISEENTIDLPLLGEINVAGMTEKDLREALITRMAKYRRHPQVGVYLERAEDRQVAVLGAVKTPGRYMLSSRSDTLMTAISRAGGITTGAASRIFLIPASITSNGSKTGGSPIQVAVNGSRTPVPVSTGTQDVGSGGGMLDPASGRSSGSTLVPASASDAPLEIDTSNPAAQRYLEIPARPGDVVLVPLAGDVTVQGWVEKPGSFNVTPGMTALNAIAAAGGPQFTSSATLLRENPGGAKESIALDLSKMKRGEQADPPVRGGDVIIVERSVLGAIPYSAYFVIQRVGVGVPLF